MSWKSRLKENAELTSPSGTRYFAKWREDTLSFDKKVGIFYYPKVNGNVVKDLGTNSDTIVTTVYFDGQDYDLDAERFVKLVRADKGLWKVELPNRVPKMLQLLSCADNNQPVAGGGIRAIDLEFIEPIDEKTLKTFTELAGLVRTGLNDLNELSMDQFANGLQTFPDSTIAGITNAVEKVQGTMKKVLGPISQSNRDIFNLTNSIQRGIQDTLSATVLEPLILASQLQQLTQMPADVLIDVQSRMSAYVNMAAEIFGLQSEDNGVDGRNTAVINELVLVSSIGASALACTVAPKDKTKKAGYSSRKEALSTAKQLVDNYDAIVDNLDETSAQFEDLDLEDQYQTQVQTSFQSAKIVRQALDYIDSLSYDLKIERKLTLTRPRNMIDIIIQEYGSLGEDESNIDLFVNSNGLKGDELLYLPSGKELVFYG